MADMMLWVYGQFFFNNVSNGRHDVVGVLPIFFNKAGYDRLDVMGVLPVFNKR